MKESKKEMLARKKFELKNKLAELRGEKQVEYENCEIYYHAKATTAYQLEYDIAGLTELVNREELKKKSKEYWNEHEEEKIRLEGLRDKIYEECENLRKSAISRINEAIEPFGIKVGQFSSDFLSIGIADEKVSPDNLGRSALEFGLHIDIYYREHMNLKYVEENGEKKSKIEISKTLEMNYGSMGSFDIMNDSKRLSYVIAMGRFAGDENVKQYIYDVMLETRKEIASLRDKDDEICKKLENPFA